MNSISIYKKLILTKKYPLTALRLIYDSFLDKYNLHKATSTAPNLVVLYLSEACNLRCSMCSVWKSRDQFGKKAQTETSFTLDDVIKLVDEVGKFKPMFYFIGGEPTLNKDIFKIIEYIHKKGMITSMTTNGFLLPYFAQKIYDSGLDFISISIDGPNSEVHDKNRGVKMSFDKATEGIRKLVMLKRQNKSIFPNIKINSVITPWNIGLQEKIIVLAKELGVDELQFGQFSFYGKKIEEMNKKYIAQKHTGEIIMGMPIDGITPFSDKKVKEISKFLNSLGFLSKKYGIGLSTQPYTNNYHNYYSGVFPSKLTSWCYNPWHVATIRQSGDMEVCQGYVVGNIKKEGIMNLWNNEKFKYFREVIHKNKITPACYRCCNLNTCF